MTPEERLQVSLDVLRSLERPLPTRGLYPAVTLPDPDAVLTQQQIELNEQRPAHERQAGYRGLRALKS